MAYQDYYPANQCAENKRQKFTNYKTLPAQNQKSIKKERS